MNGLIRVGTLGVFEESNRLSSGAKQGPTNALEHVGITPKVQTISKGDISSHKC